ncbi:unnamed protein product [Bursaphelenchus xylophilus]|uniref:(pine wood nematode) hypothetical protein n=1 Tax=Bursaphelenchus xylophilus TaxID=6326 RepID=A0A1I7S2Q2_BURXY|nr:unnamed protein product [Bursaphelenchus xylophilus]CAG9121728.1 unnamed protein product [Bursaphelenchus xylophilus]
MNRQENRRKNDFPPGIPLSKQAEPGIGRLLDELGIEVTEESLNALSKLATQLVVGILDEGRSLAEHCDHMGVGDDEIEAVCAEIDRHFESEESPDIELLTKKVNSVPLPGPAKPYGYAIHPRDSLMHPEFDVVENVEREEPEPPKSRKVPARGPTQPGKRLLYNSENMDLPPAKAPRNAPKSKKENKPQKPEDPQKVSFQNATTIKLVVHNTSSCPNSPDIVAQKVFKFSPTKPKAE